MSKSKKIRTSPVSLNESTLESNIVSEIAGLFNFPNTSAYTSRLHWFFDIPRVIPATINFRKAKIYRLTPIEEYDGGGWDSKITIPRGDGSRRAVFIQFKSGKHSDGNNITNSLFNLNVKEPNKHVEFAFNDNSDNNQHRTLKNLQVELIGRGLPSKSVLYGFPRITDLNEFENLEEDLLLHTTFLSLSEMDAKAKNAGTDLYDGQKHHFRTCYFDETRREISSEPFSLSEPEDPSGFLFELVLSKYSEWKSQMYKERIGREWSDEEFLFLLSDFLRVNPFELHEFRYFNRYPFRLKDELKKYYLNLEKNSIKYLGRLYDHEGDVHHKWRKRFFQRILTFIKSHTSEKPLQYEIPSEYTFVLPEETQLEIDVKGRFNLITF